MKWRDKDINEPNVFLEEDFYTNVDKNLKIDETLYENKSNKRPYDKFDKNSRIKFYVILTLIAALVIIIFACIFIKSDREIVKYESMAKEYYKAGNYKEAAVIYEKLYEETGNIEYNIERSNVSRHIEADEIIREATNEVKLGGYEKAIEILLTVNPLDDTTANRVFQIKSQASSKWLSHIEKDIEDKKYQDAKTEIMRFLNLQPNHEQAIEIKKKIDNKLY